MVCTYQKLQSQHLNVIAASPAESLPTASLNIPEHSVYTFRTYNLMLQCTLFWPPLSQVRKEDGGPPFRYVAKMFSTEKEKWPVLCIQLFDCNVYTI